MLKALLICTVLGMAACASAPVTPKTASNATAQKPPCVPEATRLPQKECGPGSSYDQRDISTTGQPQAGAALTVLDQRVNVTGH